MMEPQAWAEEQFGRIDLGDARRTARLVRIAASAAQAPAGTVSSVFTDDAERQGAYDFLESEHVDACALEAGVGEIVARRCADEARIFVAVDGSSLAFVDRTGDRGLGAIGTYTAGAVGLKVISALAMTTSGVPLGLLRQVVWRRSATRPSNRRPAKKRPVDKKETRHWLDAVKSTTDRINSASNSTRITFLVDREGDSAAMLCGLVRTAHNFIVRGNWDRTVNAEDGRSWKIRRLLAYQPTLGSYKLELPARAGRTARVADVMLTAACVVVPLEDPTTRRKTDVAMWAIHARETSDVPHGEEVVDWLLLSSARIDTFEQARAAVVAYTLRWRVEEFHKTWKSGHCNVEDSQLRSEQALRKWALVLATIAVRVERIKLLARTDGDAPASNEFSEVELHALLLLKRRSKKKNETIPDAPTLGQAVLWLAELGGYTGKSSGGPPGSITISRGLRRLRDMADTVAAFLAENSDEKG